jgi:serine/threonine protein kinase
MTENGIGTPIDLISAVRYYELSSDESPDGAALYGRCHQTGRGTPIDFTLAAEYFQKAADSDNAAGANDFGCCLEKGEGINKDIDRAVRYYRKAASQSHPAGLYNIGRCLEYGKGIEQDLIRAAKYYRMSAELNEPSAENSFGIWLERGIGVHSSPILAARYYQRAAGHGNPDGANNLGFCLEHGRGVEQDFRSAAECYKFARDHGHSEAELNYRRCLRILGCWDIPDRSSQIVHSRPVNDNFTHLFIDCLNDSDLSPEIISSIEGLKETIPDCPGFTAKLVGGKLFPSSVVSLEADSDGRLMAVKSAGSSVPIERVKRDVGILKRMNHPLIVKYFPNTMNHNSTIRTEFAVNGSLANHLSDSQNINFSRLRGSTRIVKIITGIAVAMRYVHSQGIIHRNLTPDNILLDWDWNVRISNFGRSISINKSIISPLTDTVRVIPGDAHYVAPEYYDNIDDPANDIFSFGLIVYELIVGKPVFAKSMTQEKVAGLMMKKSWEVDIPKSIFPETAELIRDCLATNYRERLCFNGVLDRLEEMRFKLISRVNSSKLTAFVKEMKEWESNNHSQ